MRHTNFHFQSYHTITLLILLLFTVQSSTCFAQIGGGYVVSEERMVDPVFLKLDAIDLHQTPNWSDVRAIGMGKTQIANGRFFNAMLDNPALLSNTNYLYEVFGVRANFPGETFRAAAFLKDNINQFKKPDFYIKGYLLDQGSRPTHKGIILTLYEQGVDPTEISNRTNHGLESVDSYIKKYNRVKELYRTDMSREKIKKVTGMGLKLIDQFLRIAVHFHVDIKERWQDTTKSKNIKRPGHQSKD
jgi:Protein of unknown function (DUF1670).